MTFEDLLDMDKLMVFAKEAKLDEPSQFSKDSLYAIKLSIFATLVLQHSQAQQASVIAELVEASNKMMNHQQAIIDRLMLEYFPNEMTKEQMENWEKHQVSAKVKGK